MYFGTTIYKGTQYYFNIQDNMLSIESIEEGGFNWLDAVNDEERKHEQDTFFCKCAFTGNELIAIPALPYYSFKNNTMIVQLKAIILMQKETKPISMMAIYSPELDNIYPCKTIIGEREYEQDGSANIQIRPYKEGVTEDGVFRICDTEVNIEFSVESSINYGNNTNAIDLKSKMAFLFPPTTNHDFIVQLYFCALRFLQYLCYRQNVSISSVALFSENEDGYLVRYAELITFVKGEVEREKIINERFIPYTTITKKAHRILQDIADDTLYMKHIPHSNRDARNITAARFILIVAAFDWEYRRLFPDGPEKSADRVKAINKVSEKLNKLIDETTGKTKEIWKFLGKRIDDINMQQKLSHTGEKLSWLINELQSPKPKHAKNHPDFDKIGNRIGIQRNNFAHGNIDKEFIGDSLYDILFLEKIVYAMQLFRYFGSQNEESKLMIQRGISNLFDLRIR